MITMITMMSPTWAMTFSSSALLCFHQFRWSCNTNKPLCSAMLTTAQGKKHTCLQMCAVYVCVFSFTFALMTIEYGKPINSNTIYLLIWHPLYIYIKGIPYYCIRATCKLWWLVDSRYTCYADLQRAQSSSVPLYTSFTKKPSLLTW